MPSSRRLEITAPPASDLRDRFVGFAFAAADLLVELDASRSIVFAAGVFRERFGHDAAYFEGKPLACLIAPEDFGSLEIALCVLGSRGRLAPVTLRLANTDHSLVAMAGLQLPHRSGITWLTLSRLPAAPAEVQSLAGAPQLQNAMQARLLGGEPCGVGMVEVGGWSRLPDSARLDLQREIASVMREAGGDGAMAAEMAEGRFGVLGGTAIDMPELQDRVGRILRAAGTGRPVSATSIPMALAGIGARDAMRVVRFAFSCFASGGIASVRAGGFDQGLRSFLDRTEARTASVLAALQHGRFRLVFQPVVFLSDRIAHHYEALLRPFSIAGHEFANTQEFVSFAEATGLAEALDEAVLRRAVEAVSHAPARVAVNVSGISMQSPAFRDTLFGMIDTTAELRERLMIELTETADIDDVPSAVETVNRLNALSIPVCLDDFGAGSSAFSYLKEFKVDYVKIDGSYVRKAQSGARESGFVGAMVELARGVGAQAIAEMVETEAHAATMASLGVQLGQGWLFGKPGSLPGSL
jgi:EAL domain-containing protein (putative c-di-GMP-specific phosphodiesterase class I)